MSQLSGLRLWKSKRVTSDETKTLSKDDFPTA